MSVLNNLNVGAEVNILVHAGHPTSIGIVTARTAKSVTVLSNLHRLPQVFRLRSGTFCSTAGSQLHETASAGHAYFGSALQ